MKKQIVAHINIVDMNLKERLMCFVGCLTGNIGIDIYRETMRKLGFKKI